MKRAVIIGTGAGGATAAKELQGKFDVTILEAGGSFHPFSRNLGLIETIKKYQKLSNKSVILVEHKPFVVKALSTRSINFNINKI